MNKKINPIMASCAEIKLIEFQESFEPAYNAVQALLGDSFDGLMEGLAGEIQNLQLQCRKGTTVVEATFLMCTEDAQDNPTDREYVECMKAAAWWLMRRQGQE